MTAFRLAPAIIQRLVTGDLPKGMVVVGERPHPFRALGFKPLPVTEFHFDTIKIDVEEGQVRLSISNEGLRFAEFDVCSAKNIASLAGLHIDLQGITCKMALNIE